MTAEVARRSKLAELVTYHVLGYVYRNELVTVVHGDGLAHEIGRYEVEAPAFPVSTTARYTITVPEGELAGQKITELGMLDADNLAGEPYYISIVNQEPLPPADPKTKEKKKVEGIIYNIPGKAQVTVFTPSKRYFEGELPVTQFGTTECLVDNLFNKKVNTRVIFNPNTGGIVKIDKD